MANRQWRREKSKNVAAYLQALAASNGGGFESDEHQAN